MGLKTVLLLAFVISSTMALHSKEDDNSIEPERWGAFEDSAVVNDIPPEYKVPTATEYFLFTNDETRAYLKSFLGFESYELEPFEWKQKDFDINANYTLRYVRYNFDFDEQVEVLFYERKTFRSTHK